jgi:phosphatidylglycerol lysyltransferase
MKNLRSTVNRCERDGNLVFFLHPPLDDATLRELWEVSDEWLSLPGRRERGFTFGSWDDDYVQHCPIRSAWRRLLR